MQLVTALAVRGEITHEQVDQGSYDNCTVDSPGTVSICQCMNIIRNHGDIVYVQMQHGYVIHYYS